MPSIAKTLVGAQWRWDGTLGYFLGLSLIFITGGAIAQTIVLDGRTQTTVSSSGSVTAVYTTTVRDANAFNSFQTFGVAAGRTANLFLPAGTSNLINIVRDQRTDVYGVLNSIKDGSIGGKVWFATPNGFVVGASGVVNVGSLHVSTPTAAFVENFFTAPGVPNAGAVAQLLDGSAPRSPNAVVTIDGSVNASGAVSLSAGQINVGGSVYSGARFTGTAPDFSDVVNANGLVAASNVVVNAGRIEIVADAGVGIRGTLAAPGGLDTGGQPVAAGDISLIAARSDGGTASVELSGATLLGGNLALQASSSRSAVLTPLADAAALAGLQTIDAAAKVTVDSSQLSAHGGGIDIAAAASVDVSATGPMPVAILRGSSSATVDITGSSRLSTTAGNASLRARSTVSTRATPTSPLANLAGDAMVATSDFPSTARVHVGDTASAAIDGALSLEASNAVTTVQNANASAAGSSAAGAVVALSRIDSSTSATIDGAARVESARSLRLSASSINSATVSAHSAAQGAQQDSSGSGSGSQTLAQYEDDTRTGDSGSTGSGVKVAGAVAVSDLKNSTQALLGSSQAATVGGSVTISSLASNSASVDADGSATSGATGVGVAVALNLAKSSNQALVEQNLTAQSLAVDAAMQPAGAVNAYATQAVSGAGASDVGVAGSIAVNALDHAALAAIQGAHTVTIVPGGDGDVALRASQAGASSASATPSAGAVTGSKAGIGASVAVNVVSNRSVAQIGDGADLTGARDLTLGATSAYAAHTEAEAGAQGGVAITPVVALTLTNDTTRAQLGSGSELTLAGDLKVTAQQRSGVDTTAKGSSQGDKAAIGAAVAVALVDDQVIATTARAIHADGSAGAGKGNVSFSASGASSSSASATASAKGGKSDDEAGQTDPSTGKKSEDATVDDKVDKQLGAGSDIKKNNAVGDAAEQSSTEAAAKDDKASASTSEGKISVAAAVAVNRQRSSASATVPDSGTVVAAGQLTLSTSNNTDGAALSDGSAVGSTTTLGIGAGVSVNLVKSTNEASIGRDAQVDATGVTLHAQMTDVAGDGSDLTHTLDAEAKSGAGGSKVGLAGSLALNIADTSSQALLEGGARVDAGRGAVELRADDRSSTTAKALPADDGGASGAKVGIGASVAVNVVSNRAIAEVQDHADLDHPGDLELSATGKHAVHTEAEAGASGGVAITPVVALALANNTTSARLGSGSALVGAGKVSITADHASTTTTSAKGSAQGDKAAVGAAVGIVLLDDVAAAVTARDIVDGTGPVTIAAHASSASTNSASASSKGGKSDDEAGQTDPSTGKKSEDATVDDKVGGQLDFGKQQQTDNDVGDAKQQSATSDAAAGQPSAKSDEGKVSVAAAVVVNIVDAHASATVADGVTVRTGAAFVLDASGNTDSSAQSDGDAVGKTAQVGIGAAVSVNKVDSHSEASIGAGASVTAQGVRLNASMTDVAGDLVNTVNAQAQSGAGGSKVGIAASLALNLTDTSGKALVKDGAKVDAGGGDLVLQAEDRSSVSAKAEPTTSGGADGGKVGVGVSVALNLVTASSQARVGVGAQVSNTRDLRLAATTAGDTSAVATAGATGGKLAFDAAVAVTTLDQHADASVAAGSDIGASRDVSLSALSSGAHGAQTKGVAKSGSVAVGASVGVIDSSSSTTATIDRNLAAGGNFDLAATATRSYDADASASAGGSQSDDTYSANKTQADSASSSKALAKNQDDQTNQGTQGGGKVSVAAAVGVVAMRDDVNAAVTGARTISSGVGRAMNVAAVSQSNFSVRGAGDAVDPNTKVGVGIGVGIAIDKDSTTAALDDGIHVASSGDLRVQALSSQNTDPVYANKLTAEGLAGAGGSKVGVAGAFAVAYSNTTTRATIGNGARIDDSGAVWIDAQNTATLSAKAWAGAFGKVGIGASVATVISDNDYDAALGSGSQVRAASLQISATNHRFSPTPFSLDLSGVGDMSGPDSAKEQLKDIADQFTSGKLLGGGNYYTEAAAGAAGDKVAVAGAFAVNVFSDRTDAALGADTKVDVGSGALLLTADNDTVARSLAGSLAAGGNVGVGVSSAVVSASNVTRSHVDAGVVVDHSGQIALKSSNAQDIEVIGVAGGVSESVAVSGVANVITLDNTVEAVVAASHGTALNTTGAFEASATQRVKGVNIATGLSVSGNVAVGVVGAVNTLGTDSSHLFATRASIGNDVAVNAGTGTTLSASASEDLTSFAIAGAASGSVSVGGAAIVNVINSDTSASLGDRARLNDAQALVNQSASLSAHDDTAMFNVVAGVAAGGGVGVGASGDVAVIDKSTRASIGQGSVIATAGNLSVQATASEDLRSIAIGLGVGGTAGAAGSVSVYSLTGNTLAWIGDDARLRVRGNALVAADDASTMNLISGSASGGGAAAIGAAAGVTVFDKTTQAGIGVDADIEVLGDGASDLMAANGDMAVDFDAAISGNGQVKGTGISPKDAQGNTVAGGQADAIGDRNAFQAVTQTRTATPVLSAMRGLAVTATNRDKLNSFSVTGAAGGGLAVTLGGNVAVLTIDTEASIGAGTQVNQNSTAANGGQSVRVAAGGDQFHLGLAGAASGSGGAAIGAGADVMVADNTVKATIGAGARVGAARDVEVLAHGQGQYLEMGAGLAAAGSLAIAGSVGVLSLNDTTVAQVVGGAGTSTLVGAGGNLRVDARDDTETNMIAGAAAAGFGTAGFGVAVGVNSITKHTAAEIGDAVTVDALGGSGAAALSAYLPDAASDASTTTMHGLQVQAQSTEDLFMVSASGAGGLFAGVSGAVTVTVVDSDTLASIGNNAKINLTNAGAASDQDVNVSARNELKSLAFTGSVGVGAAGISGGVDVFTAKNDTSAAVGAGTELHAARDVVVNALSTTDLSTTVVSAAAGLVAGVAGGVSLYSVGDQLGSDAQGQLTGNGDVKAQADREARSGAIDDLLKSSKDSRVQSTSAKAQAQRAAVSTAAATSGSPPTGNSATIGAGAKVFSGRDTAVNARASLAYQSTTGAAAVGALGLGAGIGIANFHVDSLATVGSGAQVSAGGDLRVHASLTQADRGVEALAFAGTGGIIAVNAAWASLSDDSSTTASLGSGVRVLDADAVVVEAGDTRNLDAQAFGASVGAIAAGASVSNAQLGGSTSASIGSGSFIGTAGNPVGSLTVDADSRVRATSSTLAAAGGIGVLAASGSSATAVAAPVVAAHIDGGNIRLTGDAKVQATGSAGASADALGFSVSGGLGIGASLASARSTPQISAYLGDGTVLGAADIRVAASHLLPGYLYQFDTSLSRSTVTGTAVRAAATGTSGGLLLGATGTDAEADYGSDSKQARVQAHVGDGSTLTVPGDLIVTANNDSGQSASASGLSFGLAAIGSNDAYARSNSQTVADLGRNVTVNGDAGGSAAITATGTDRNIATSVSGSGGVVAGAAATANTVGNSDTRAFVGDPLLSSSGAISTGRVTIEAQHDTVYNAKVDSTQASVAGASGASNRHDLNSVVNAGVGVGVQITASTISLLADNATHKFWWGRNDDANTIAAADAAAWNVDSGSGGLLNLPAGQTQTNLRQLSSVSTGENSLLHVTLPAFGDGSLRIDAVNTIVSYDKTKLDSGGAIALAESKSIINAGTAITPIGTLVTLGKGSTISSDSGDIAIGSRNDVKLDARAVANAYGLAGAPSGEAYVNYFGSSTTTLGADALLLASDPDHGEIHIGAGRSSSQAASAVVANSSVNLWNKTAVPINSTPDAQTYLTQQAGVDIAAGSNTLAAGDIGIIADRGRLDATAVGVGKDLYREVAAAIAGAFGIDAALDIKGGLAPTPEGQATVTVDGTVLSGLLRQSATQIDVQILSPWTYNAGTGAVSIGWGLTVSQVDSRAHPGDLTADPLGRDQANPYIGWVAPPALQESSVAPNSLLQARLDKLHNLRAKYTSDPVASAAYDSEIAFLEKKLVSQGVGQNTAGVTPRASAALDAAGDANTAISAHQVQITGDVRGATAAKQIGAVGTLIKTYGEIDASNTAIDGNLVGMKSAAPTTDPDYAALNTARLGAAMAYNGGATDLSTSTGVSNLVSATDRIGHYGYSVACLTGPACAIEGPLGTLGSAAGGATLTISGAGYLGTLQDRIGNISLLALNRSGASGTLVSNVQDISTQLNNVKNANATIVQAAADIRANLSTAAAKQSALSTQWRDTADKDNVDLGRIALVDALTASNAPKIASFDATAASSPAHLISTESVSVATAATAAALAVTNVGNASDQVAPGSEKLLSFPDISVKLGNVNVVADVLAGNGSLQAPGDAKIWIIDNAPASMNIGSLLIDSTGGNVRLNGFLVNGDADLRRFNPAYTGALPTIVSRENGAAGSPEIRVVSTYDPGAYCCTANPDGVTPPTAPAPGTPAARQVPGPAPDITLGYRTSTSDPRKQISNPSGSVDVTSAAGDIYVDGAITAGSVSILARNGDFVQQYVNGFDSVAGEPSNNAQGGTGVLSPVQPVGNGIVANGNIFISARYLNINGLVQSGIVDYHLDIPDDATLRFVVPNTLCPGGVCADPRLSFQANWVGLDGSKGRTVATKGYIDSVYKQSVDVAVTTNGSLDYGAIAATYDYANQKIVMSSSAKVRGGSIVLFGQIIDTADGAAGGTGKLAVLDGFGRIAVDNQSSLPVELKTLDTGVDPNAADPGRGVAGTIDITDVQYVGASGDQQLHAIRTLITRDSSGIKVDQTGAWNGAAFDPNAAVSSYAVDQNSASRVGIANGPGVDPTRNGNYNPQAGLRYVFTTGTTTSTQYTWIFKGQSFFGQSSLAVGVAPVGSTLASGPNVLSNVLLPDGTYLSYKAPVGAVAHNNNLKADAAVAGSSSPAGVARSSVTATDTDVFSKVREWNDCDWWSLCISSKYTSIWTQSVGQTTVTTNSVKADYPIQIEFMGADSAQLTVNSPKAAVSLGGGEQLNNRYGDTTMTVQSLAAATGSLIDTRNLNVTASTGSIGAVDAPLNMLLSGALTANATSGNVVVRQIAGALQVAEVNAAADPAGGVGKAILIAQDSIHGSTADSRVSGARIELSSSTGSIGGIVGSATNTAGYLPLRVTPGYTADRSQQPNYGLKASAAGDIGLDVKATGLAGNNPAGHLLVDQVVSAGGDVRITAPGQIIDDNPIFSIDTRSYVQLLAYADTIGLRGSTASNAGKLAQAVDALQSSRTQDYTQYWALRDAQHAPASYDPAWQYVASNAEKAALNNDAAAISRYQSDRTARYWRLADEVAGFDDRALARGQEAARLLSEARAQDALQVEAAHPTWTSAQVDAQVHLDEVNDTTRLDRVQAQVLAADAAGSLTPASRSAPIDGFFYIAGADERAAQAQGSSWTNSQLALAFNPGLLKDLTDTNPVVKAPNVSGRKVELIARTSLGSTLPASDPAAVTIPLDTNGDLTPEQKVALATAEFSDFVFSDPAHKTGTLTISQRLPVNFSASQGLSASVGDTLGKLTDHVAGTDTGNAYLATLGSAPIQSIAADGEVRLKAKGAITAVDPTATSIRAGDLILEAANATIGGDAQALTPLRVEVARGASLATDSQGSLSARAAGRINLVEAGDMALGGIFSRDAVLVASQTGSIVNARPADNSGLVLLGGTVQMSAPQGSIGNVAADQPVGVGSNIGTQLSGLIQADAGQWIYLKGSSNPLVPSNFLIGPVLGGADALNAGAGIQLWAEGDLVLNGLVVTPGTLNIVSGGRITASAGRDITVGNPNSQQGTQILHAPAAQIAVVGSTYVDADQLLMEDGATLQTAGTIRLHTEKDAVVTGISTSDPTVDAVRIRSRAGSILAGHTPGSDHLDIVADAEPAATLTMDAATGIGAEPLNLKVLNLDASSGGVVDLAVQGAVNVGTVLAADRVWLSADGAITGGSIRSSGTGPNSDQSITVDSTGSRVELKDVSGTSEVGVAGLTGVALGSVASAGGSVEVQSALGDVGVSTAGAAKDIVLSAPAGSIHAGQTTAGGRIDVSASGAISGDEVTGTGGQPDARVTITSQSDRVDFVAISGQADVEVNGSTGVALGSVASAGGSVEVQSALGRVDLGSVSAAADLSVSGRDGVVVDMAGSGQQMVLSSQSGDVGARMLTADSVSIDAAGHIMAATIKLNSALWLAGTTVNAAVYGGNQLVTGAVTGYEGLLASQLNLTLSAPGGFALTDFRADRASVDIPVGVFSVDEVRLFDQAMFRNPQTSLLVDQDHRDSPAADVELYSAGAPFYLGLSGNQVRTNAYVIRRSPLHEVTTPFGPTLSAAEVIEATLARASLVPAPVTGQPIPVKQGSLVTFTGVPVSTKGACAPALNPDCKR